jgi:hypothetical protein
MFVFNPQHGRTETTTYLKIGLKFKTIYFLVSLNSNLIPMWACMKNFKYLETTLTDQDCMHEEIKSRINSGNACYHSVQSLLSSRLLSRDVKVKIYKTIILLVVLYGCETWSLTLREEHRLRVFENRV